VLYLSFRFRRAASRRGLPNYDEGGRVSKRSLFPAPALASLASVRTDSILTPPSSQIFFRVQDQFPATDKLPPPLSLSYVVCWISISSFSTPFLRTFCCDPRLSSSRASCTLSLLLADCAPGRSPLVLNTDHYPSADRFLLPSRLPFFKRQQSGCYRSVEVHFAGVREAPKFFRFCASRQRLRFRAVFSVSLFFPPNRARTYGPVGLPLSQDCAAEDWCPP